jgi:5-hydroxyisourate hydrolase
VLDTMHGCPAEAVEIQLFSGDDLLFEGQLDSSGRCRIDAALVPGRYRLSFAVAGYFRGKGVALPDPPFLDVVSIDFGVSEADAHYHVPLLVSPFAYSTYRGS